MPLLASAALILRSWHAPCVHLAGKCACIRTMPSWWRTCGAGRQRWRTSRRRRYA